VLRVISPVHGSHWNPPTGTGALQMWPQQVPLGRQSGAGKGQVTSCPNGCRRRCGQPSSEVTETPGFSPLMVAHKAESRNEAISSLSKN
jgi:hypothetical protein